MLVLSRRKGEKLIINKCIEVVVTEIRGDKVRLGVTAPKDMTIDREEIALLRKEIKTYGE